MPNMKPILPLDALSISLDRPGRVHHTKVEALATEAPGLLTDRACTTSFGDVEFRLVDRFDVPTRWQLHIGRTTHTVGLPAKTSPIKAAKALATVADAAPSIPLPQARVKAVRGDKGSGWLVVKPRMVCAPGHGLEARLTVAQLLSTPPA